MEGKNITVLNDFKYMVLRLPVSSLRPDEWLELLKKSDVLDITYSTSKIYIGHKLKIIYKIDTISI